MALTNCDILLDNNINNIKTLTLMMVTQVIFIYTGINSETARVVSVCPGEQVVLMCIATNRSISLRWTITIPKGSMLSRSVPYTGSRILTPINEMLNNVTVTFNFTRTSDDGTFPLTSQLALDMVTNDMHGTKIHCSPSDPQVNYLIHIQGGTK